MNELLQRHLPQLADFWQAFTGEVLYGWSDDEPVSLAGSISSAALETGAGLSQIKVEDKTWLVAHSQRAFPPFYLGSVDPGGTAGQLLNQLSGWLDQMSEAQAANQALSAELNSAWNRLNFLFEINRIDNQGGDLPRVFTRVAQFLLQVITAEEACLVVQEASQTCSYTASGRALLAPELVIGLAPEPAEPVFLQPGEDLFLPWADLVPEFRNLLLVRMPLEGPVVGILGLVNYPGKALALGDRQLLVSAAEHIATLVNMALTRSLQEANQRLEHELQIASQIQANFLPTRLPEIPEVEFTASLHPAQQVGGDFYDVQPVQGGVAVMIGDVAGKGIPAAMLTALMHATFKSEARHHTQPAALLQAINALVYDDLDRSGTFITAFLGVLQTNPLRLTYASAGHTASLMWRCIRQEVAQLSGTGLPLGVFPQMQLVQHQIRLHPGDVLYLYSDGITETENDSGRVFGIQAMVDLLLALHPAPVAQQLRLVLEALDLHRRDQPLHDDITLFLARVQPASPQAGTVTPFVFSAEIQNVRQLAELVRGASYDLHFDSAVDRSAFLNELELAVSEIATNIIVHAYRQHPDTGRIQGCVSAGADRVKIELVDSGLAYRPEGSQPALYDGDPPAGGYGLALAQRLLDACQYQRLPGGRNYWVLEKCLHVY